MQDQDWEKQHAETLREAINYHEQALTVKPNDATAEQWVSLVHKALYLVSAHLIASEHPFATSLLDSWHVWQQLTWLHIDRSGTLACSVRVLGMEAGVEN